MVPGQTGDGPAIAPAAPGATVQGDQVKVKPLAGTMVLLKRTVLVLATAAVVAAHPVEDVLALKSVAAAPLKPTCVSRMVVDVADKLP